MPSSSPPRAVYPRRARALDALKEKRDRRRRPRRLGQGAAAAGTSAAAVRQCAGEPAYRGRHQGGAGRVGSHRRRATARRARRQAAAADHQSRGVAGLFEAVCRDFRRHAEIGPDRPGVAEKDFFAAGPDKAIKPLPGSRPAKRSLLFSLISRLLSPEASSSRRGRLSGPARNLSYGKGSQTAGNRPVPVRTRVCALC